MFVLLPSALGLPDACSGRRRSRMFSLLTSPLSLLNLLDDLNSSGQDIAIRLATVRLEVHTCKPGNGYICKERSLRIVVLHEYAR